MTSAGLICMVLLIISLTSARDVMSGCEDQKIYLGEVYLQITTSRDCQWMESALDVHISVSNNITSIIANVFYIGILLRRLEGSFDGSNSANLSAQYMVRLPLSVIAG